MKKTWNKNLIVGKKMPLSTEQVKLLKLSIGLTGQKRDLLMFSIAMDSNLRGVDLVSLKVGDIFGKDFGAKDHFYIRQRKTHKPVMCSLSDETKALLVSYIVNNNLTEDCYLFTSLYNIIDNKNHITPHHYRELIRKWMKAAGLDPKKYTSHSIRRTRISYIYKKTGNLRACQMLLGHSSILNTALYLGVEELEALAISKQHYL